MSFHLNPCVKTADYNWIVRVQQERCRATFLESRAACQQTRNLLLKVIPCFQITISLSISKENVHQITCDEDDGEVIRDVRESLHETALLLSL